MSCQPQESRTQETKRPRVGPRTQVPLTGRVPILSSRNRASPTSVLADEKVMPEKEPILVLVNEKGIIGLMSSPAEDEPYITSTKNTFACLGELMDAEVATVAASSLDKMSGWPEGGIASAGKIVEKMSGCARARLKWCSRSWTMSMPGGSCRMSALTRACPRMPRARAPPSHSQGNQRENAKKELGV